MIRTFAAVVWGAALALAAAVAVEAQVPEITIADRRIDEGDVGQKDISFAVALSQASSQTITITWGTPGVGSAVIGEDYVGVPSAILTIPPLQTNAVVTVRVIGDIIPESAAQTFAVDIVSATNATIRKARAIGTILDDDTAAPPVSSFAVVAPGGSSASTPVTNRLIWRIPVGDTAPTTVLIRWNEADDTCAAPTSAVIPHPPAQQALLAASAPDQTETWDHTTAVPGRLYCYSIWVGYALYSGPASVRVRPPLDSAGRVRWVYATSETGPALEAPTVGPDAVYTVDATGAVHALGRGSDPSAGAGLWPPGWNPVTIGKRAHFRSPVVPLPEGPRLFVGTEDGEINAVNGLNGSLVWNALLTPTPVAGGAQAPLAGIFKAFRGEHDMLLVGTAAATGNVFRALNPSTGAQIDSFAAGSGATSGMATVDYGARPNRVYFTSRPGTASETLWAFELGPLGTDDLTERWRLSTGASDSAPVFRGDRLYHGDNAGYAYSVRASDGGDVRSFNTNDGAIKGYLFPDLYGDALYASTTNRVWKLRDAGSLTAEWSVSVPSASIALFWLGTTYVYSGGGDGRLYQIDTSGNADNSVRLPTVTATPLGAPSLDAPNGILLVPSANCVFAVRVPY
jgi:hypothetical protein